MDESVLFLLADSGRGHQGHLAAEHQLGIGVEELGFGHIRTVFINYGASDLSMLIGVPEGTEVEAQKVLAKALGF